MIANAYLRLDREEWTRRGGEAVRGARPRADPFPQPFPQEAGEAGSTGVRDGHEVAGSSRHGTAHGDMMDWRCHVRVSVEGLVAL